MTIYDIPPGATFTSHKENPSRIRTMANDDTYSFEIDGVLRTYHRNALDCDDTLEILSLPKEFTFDKLYLTLKND